MEKEIKEIIELVLFRICNPKAMEVDFKSTTLKFGITNPEQRNSFEDSINNIED